MARARRICGKTGCPNPATGRYCTQHNREADKARGSREARGYTNAHRELRKAFIPEHQAGTLTCWRCKQIIPANEPFDLGHDDEDRTIYRGPEHTRCNRSAAGKRAHLYD
jgi:hypothetical protein